MIRNASWGGIVCEYDHLDIEYTPCDLEDCPPTCEASWSQYDECTVTCGGGVQHRTYIILSGAEVCSYPDGVTASQECKIKTSFREHRIKKPNFTSILFEVHFICHIFSR